MYARKFAETTRDHPACFMASTGETVTHREYDERANRLAHLLRDAGLNRGDHYALFMENNNRFLEVCAAGERAGLYYTPVNSYLKADELAYIVQNSESQVLITSRSRRDVAIEAAAQCPKLRLCLIVDGTGDDGPVRDYATETARFPGTLWFSSGSAFTYFNDTEKTKESTSPDGAMTTVGDVGYVDDDGFLYLTDRATFMIISGGVNIYPQESENLLVTHPKVVDVAVFGVPN
ncbi:MAG: AMP-binding protein, partial [Actinomycetota bacterium]